MKPTPLLLALVLILAASAHRAETLSPAQVADLRARISDQLFVPSPLPDLAARTHRRFQPAPGVTAEAVTYATQLGSQVPAILYLPDPLPTGKRLPGFVVVNGHGGDKYAWYAYYTGVAFARGGMAVLTYDQAGEGERSPSRRSGTRDHDKLQGDALLARRLAGLMITDVRQAVSYLAARPEVDAMRLGAGGYSLGSFVLALAGALEPRLRACVLVGGGNLDGPEGYWDRSKPMCQGLPYRALGFLGDRPAVIYALHAARGPLLFANGRADTVVNMPATQEAFFDDLRARVVARRGTAEGVFEYWFSSGTSHRPYWLMRPAVAWLEQQLDFPAWDAAAIERWPTTQVATWAARHGMTLDKLYATEEREGGTPAIGADIPGITREQLSVFTAAEWETRRDELSLDGWAARARRP
jgi:dienelactone hydrolase